MTHLIQRPHYVYRHHDADGRALYIGRTCNPTERFAAQRTAEWWPQVAHTQVIGPMSYAEAIHAETWAIRADLPPHNKDIPRPRTLAGIRLGLRIVYGPEVQS